MKPEPTPRKDGRCFMCAKKRKTITTYAKEDAFCGSACCREYFGTTLPKPERGVPVGASS